MNNRRSFIKTLLAGTGVLASGALTTAVAMVPSIPVGAAILYCDGIHDDAPALQQWVDHKPVYYVSGERVGNKLYGKSFLIGDTVHLTYNPEVPRLYIDTCIFTPSEALKKAELPMFMSWCISEFARKNDWKKAYNSHYNEQS